MGRLTIADIARQAGVSKATVSRVLNKRPEGVGKETRERIEAILAQTCFQPSAMARCLATGRSCSIGLIIPDIGNPFYPLLVRGVERTLHDSGYSLFLCNADCSVERETDYVRALIDKAVDGVILDSAGSQKDAQVGLLQEAGIPFVVLDRVIGQRSAHFGVFLDNQRGAREAVECLLQREDASLVFLNGPAQLSQSIERLAGVEEAVRARQLPAERLLVLEGDFSLDSGFRHIEALLASPAGRDTNGTLRFNAVFAANDVMAIGALRALRQARLRVPEDVEIIGFDDIDLASMVDPPLSTVTQPVLDMGAASAELLLRLISGKKPRNKTVEMTPRLTLRGTTRARPAAPPTN
jgi:LacI family transcriptional regulator